MIEGDSPQKLRSTRTDRQAAGSQGPPRSRTNTRETCLRPREWEAERSITVTARILSGDQSLRMQKVTSLG